MQKIPKMPKYIPIISKRKIREKTLQASPKKDFKFVQK
jgi:hypothetical protein